MVLHAVKATRFVCDRRGRAHLGVRHQFKALRHPGHVVSVAHPRNALRRQTLEQLAVRVIKRLGLAVFARRILLRCGDKAAQRMRHELAAIADAQHRDTQLEQLRVALGRLLIINAVRPAGKDDADRVHCADLIDRGLIGLDLAVYIMLADTPRDQLVILTAEVQHQNELMVLHD